MDIGDSVHFHSEIVRNLDSQWKFVNASAVTAGEDFPLAGAIWRAYQPFAFHLLDERGRPVIPDPQAALQVAGCCPPFAQNDIDGLVVKIVPCLPDRAIAPRG